MFKKLFFASFVCLAVGAVVADGAIFVVTNSAASGPGSLDDAVDGANVSPPPNTITFNIPGPTPAVITASSSLTLLQSVAIDATTQPGYSSNAPAVWLDGGGLVNIGVNVVASNCLIRGLRIQGHTLYGVSFAGESNRLEACQVFSNTIGVIVAERNHTIGGGAASNRNVISGNSDRGVYLYGSFTSNNVIMGNWIGVSPTNSAIRFPNGAAGIDIERASGNDIAGTPASRQVISGNGTYGIRITQAEAVSNRVRGNAIGTDAAATTVVSNGADGIYLSLSAATLIGGTNSADANYIAGNQGSGIHVQFVRDGSTRIEGNVIGLSASETSALPNRFRGINLLETDQLVIGGTGTGAGNTIAGNGGEGIYVRTTASNTLIQGNRIGINAAGNAMSNSTYGILIAGAGCQVGGTNAGAGNVIAGNGGEGVLVNFAINSVIQGNRIGVNAAGLPRPNRVAGVSLATPQGCLVGGATTNAGNIIAGNVGCGILVNSATTNFIRGNWIGLLPDGTVVSNSLNGIRFSIGSGLVIGGTTPGERNVVSGNGGNNIALTADSTQSVVVGNFIGVNPAGTSAASYDNLGVYGIAVDGRDHRIGGSTAGEGNVISGNRAGGIELRGRNVLIAGNVIGLGANGLSVVSNGTDGITLIGASNCVIGGTVPAARNVIGGNGDRGIDFDGLNPANNGVIGNYIGVAADGLTTRANASTDMAFSLGGVSNQVGGRTAAERNIIRSIVLSSASARFNVFEGNWIAVDIQGRMLTNASFGIDLSGGASDNLFGGAEPGAGNVIGGTPYAVNVGGTNSARNRFEGNFVGIWTNGVRLNTNALGAVGFQFSQGQQNTVGGTNPAAGNRIGYYIRGISIAASNRNAFLGNTIVSNSSLAIDFLGDGLSSVNDAFDVDGGPNDGQNHPVVTNATSFFGSTFVQGYVSSKASSSYRIEFFSSPLTSPLQANRFLGFTNVVTAANGTGLFSVVLGGYAPTGWHVRATATDTNGNTSEFGNGATVTPATDVDNDKMPGFWETLYGLNPSVSNSITADADGDGISDREEYIADTNPSDPASRFRFVQIAGSDPAAEVSFPSSANRLYDLDAATSLVEAAWFNVATNLPGSGNVRPVDDPSGATTRIYRVRAKIPSF